MATSVTKAVAKLWIDGQPVELAQPAEFVAHLDETTRTWQWTLRAAIPEGPHNAGYTVSAVLEDGSRVHGRTRRDMQAELEARAEVPAEAGTDAPSLVLAFQDRPEIIDG